ncbi:hypothetical protein EWM64_g8179 [Hericium alpestre]|uniref:Essential protein Yae1 N-terminal domain-containing protein n=1 Tax=Hericium alpestre TaxID=135208 RepID=A0A4Y9ZPS4_9AGAM|nr:hypothetical protein EWM64_g8179 [Hericium alpestre]
MGKKKRATTAAWRAAAAASLPLPTITSLATPLVATITFADLSGPNTANEPPPALTQQPNDSHARTACPAHPAPSIAPHSISASSNSTPTSRSYPAPLFSNESEPDRRPVPAECETRNERPHPAPHTTSSASQTPPATPHDSRTLAHRAIRPSAAENKSEKGLEPHMEDERTASNAQRGHAPRVSTPAPLASNMRAETPDDAPAPPRPFARPHTSANELGDHRGVRADDTTGANQHHFPSPVPSPSSTPHAAHLAQHAPTASNNAPAPAHNDVKPPTPGIEPDEPRMAAAYQPPVPEPAFVDRALHNDIVATAIQKGYEAGLKAGRNSGFREGLAVRTKAGPSARREEDSSESTKQGSPEASTPASLAMSIDEIDADLLARIRKEAEYGVWEEGLEAGMTMGRKEGREAGYSEGLEAGRKMGIMEGRERGFEDGKSAGVQAGRVLERVEVRRIARPSVHVQTNNQPVRTYADAAVRTSESPPTPHADTAMQTLPLYAAAMPLIEDPDPALLNPMHLKEIVVMALSDGHAAGLKEGWNVGLQEGLATGRKGCRSGVN